MGSYEDALNRAESRREAEANLAKRRFWRYVKIGVGATVGIFGVFTVLGGFYTVSPTEMAGLRRFNRVVTAEPIGPGLHFKAPWIETVDKLQVSLTKFSVNHLKVYTIDNQPISLSVSLTYDIPKSQVLHLLYDVGSAGNFDTFSTIEPVIADRAQRIFSQENTVSISEDRAALDAKIEKSVQQSVGSMFGLHIDDFQITGIQYSPTFEQSIDAAVQAKNHAIQAENTVNQKKFEAEQVKVAAEGQAQAAIAQADGYAQARITKAKADAKAVILEGDARAKAVDAIGSAVTANPQIVSYDIAQRWNGGLPATMLGGGALPFINLPNTKVIR